ncbi:MAG: hypothetical protein AB2L24_29350 [Mangrovibacterium sp.]
MLLPNDELKALIEHEERNLLFYAMHCDLFEKELPMMELERQINFHLDRLIDLLKQLKDRAAR